jgi:hypothetical protein
MTAFRELLDDCPLDIPAMSADDVALLTLFSVVHVLASESSVAEELSAELTDAIVTWAIRRGLPFRPGHGPAESRTQ